MRKEMDSKGTWIFENNNWVVQSNKLIEAQMSSSLLEKKIFVAVVMQIQPTDEKFKEYSVGVKRMLEELRISKTDFYREIDKATDNLLSRNVVIEKVDVKKSKKAEKSFTKVSLMTYADYTNGVLTLKVNEDMKPYLLNLSQSFTKYQIKNVLDLKSVYSIRLYELMRQRLGLGKRTLYVMDLRKMLGLSDEDHTRFIDFERRVLKKAIQEINEKTDLRIEYEKIKLGRTVEQIDFTIDFQGEAEIDRELREYFSDTYPIDKMKREMGIENLKLTSKQIIEVYSAAVDKLSGVGKVEMTEERIYKLVRMNLEYTERMRPDKSFYGYFLKAVKEDMAKAVLVFFAEDMGLGDVLSTPKLVEEEIDEEAERSAGYNFEW